MVDLETVKEEESPKEWMDWISQTPNHKGYEAYPFIILGIGNDFLHSVFADGGEDGARVSNF